MFLGVLLHPEQGNFPILVLFPQGLQGWVLLVPARGLLLLRPVPGRLLLLPVLFFFVFLPYLSLVTTPRKTPSRTCGVTWSMSSWAGFHKYMGGLEQGRRKAKRTQPLPVRIQQNIATCAGEPGHGVSALCLRLGERKKFLQKGRQARPRRSVFFWLARRKASRQAGGLSGRR